MLFHARDDYLRTHREETPLSYLKNEIETFLGVHKPEIGFDNLLLHRELPPEWFSILPGSLQFYDRVIRSEGIHIPSDLVHKTRFIATGPNGEAYFDETVETFRLLNQELFVDFEPASVEDQILINSYSGLDATPPYLIRVRPVLVLDGANRIAVGQGGMQMGREFRLQVHLISPNGTEIHTNTLRAGELASLLRLRLARPLPTLATMGNVVETTWLGDFPVDLSWKGVYIDVAGRYVEAVGGVDLLDRLSPSKLFMELSSLQGSVLEGKAIRLDHAGRALHPSTDVFARPVRLLGSHGRLHGRSSPLFIPPHVATRGDGCVAG